MNINVCVGSSCHLKGSYEVIEAFKTILKKYDVEDMVELQASFCIGYCSEGVNVKADDLCESAVQKIGEDHLFLHGVTTENVESVFVKDVLPLLAIEG